MNSFQKILIAVTYEEVATGRKKGDKPITAADLLPAVETNFWHWRNHRIQGWADWITNHFEVEGLAELADDLLEAMLKVDGAYACAFDRSDCWAYDEDLAFAVAHGLAVLYWYRREAAGRPYTLCPTIDDVDAWLQAHPIVPISRNKKQMSLFLSS